VVSFYRAIACPDFCVVAYSQTHCRVEGISKMDMRHIIVLVAVLALGYWLGRKFPSVLAGVPVLGS
jgi:hypothetical protein